MPLFGKKLDIDKAVEIGEKISDSKNEKYDRLIEILDREDDDRQEARDLLLASTKKILHYIIAGAIVVGFLFTLFTLLPAIAEGKMKELDGQAGIILGTLVTAVLAGLATIRDFLFGSSDSDKETAKSLTQANNPDKRAELRHQRKMARIENRK